MGFVERQTKRMKEKWTWRYWEEWKVAAAGAGGKWNNKWRSGEPTQ